MALTPQSFTDATATPSRATRKYKDVSLSFTRHPITGDIASLIDADAVKRSVRNLINTDFFERPFHPEIGSNIRKTLLLRLVLIFVKHCLNLLMQQLLKLYQYILKSVL